MNSQKDSQTSKTQGVSVEKEPGLCRKGIQDDFQMPQKKVGSISDGSQASVETEATTSVACILEEQIPNPNGVVEGREGVVKFQLHDISGYVDTVGRSVTFKISYDAGVAYPGETPIVNVIQSNSNQPLKTKEVAKNLGLHRKTVCDYIRKGYLKVLAPGRPYLITPESFLDFKKGEYLREETMPSKKRKDSCSLASATGRKASLKPTASTPQSEETQESLAQDAIEEMESWD
jgi:excisionase family DNA binding protein